MSHYRKIVTSLVQGETLRQALAALHVQAQYSPDLLSPTLKLENNYDRPQLVSILVSQEAARDAGLLPTQGFGQSLFGRGFGYVWDPQAGAFGVVQDGMDASKLQSAYDRIAQRYAVIEATQAALAAGWSVYETASADGSIELQVQRSY